MRVLFLQGHPSAFSRDVGRALKARGHGIRRVNLCFGDWLFWHGPECISYRGGFSEWEEWIGALMQREGVTHLVYFADRHPYHVAAQRAALRLGVVCLSYEFGYLRPDWILVETGGQSAFSHFPDRIETVKRLAEGLPSPDMTRHFGHPLWQEALCEMAYHLGNVLFGWLFPRFKSDRVDHPVLEYLSYLPRNLSGLRARKEARRITADVQDGREPFHLVALQMAGDYQIRANSPFADPVEFLRRVLRSYAEAGPAEGRLIFKLHPLDNGRVPWRRLVRRQARDVGLERRVVFLDGGDLTELLRRARGCVVVNSTVGLHALQAGCPVKCLGIATYDMAGLTHAGPLESFWTLPERPDPLAVDALIRVMAACLHLRGDFFAPEGRAAAVAGFVDLIETDRAGRMGAVCAMPPRLGAARRMGLSVAPWDDPVPGTAVAPSGQADAG